MVQLFINCFTNTLDTTVKRLETGLLILLAGGYTGYVAAGQCGADPALISWRRERIRRLRTCWWGLFGSSSFYVNLDPYANAFNQEANGNCWEHDETDMLPWIYGSGSMSWILCVIRFSWLIWCGKIRGVRIILMKPL